MHRYRAGKIKREHTIIPGVLPLLEQVAAHPRVSAVIPGPIHPKSAATRVYLSYQYPTDSGFKLLARNTSAVQEVFIVTGHPHQVLEQLVADGLVEADEADARAQAEPVKPAEPASSPAGSRGGGSGTGGRKKERKNAKGRTSPAGSPPGAWTSKDRSNAARPSRRYPAGHSLDWFPLHSLQTGDFNATLGGRLSPQLRRRLRQAAADADSDRDR